MVICEVGGCGRPVMARGMCSGHYQRWRISGDAAAAKPLRPSHRRIVGDLGRCSVGECDRAVRIARRGLCNLHYQRWRKYGTADAPYLRYQRDSWVTDAGYVRVKTGTNQSDFEHRVAMAEALGRPLEPDENIHHLNGDRADNRLENLELWVCSQPPGQRVDDQIKWAKALLARYAPHLLAAADDN